MQYRRELSHEAEGVLDLKRVNGHGPISFQFDLYMMLRQLKPAIIVETGTRKGVATSMILEAIRRNECGHLYSCDPIHVNQEAAEKAIKKAIGYECNSDDWTFISGSSAEMFQAFASHDTFARAPVDVFIHDSDHRQKCMRMELEWAWEHVRPGGVIVCDDWEQRHHSTFQDFVETMRGEPFSEASEALGRTARWLLRFDSKPTASEAT